MGYIRHDAIVVTSWNTEMMQNVATFAKELGLLIEGPTVTGINGFTSFLVCPDGSKEGWDESDKYDDLRGKLIEHIKSKAYSDGSSALHWVHVAFGPDDEDAEIEEHAWSAQPASKAKGE